MEKIIIDNLLKKIPAPAPAKTRANGDFLLIMPTRKPEMLVLNPTASFMLNLCDNKKTVREIVDIMCSKYSEIQRERITLDTIKCLRDMEGKFILKLTSAPDNA